MATVSTTTVEVSVLERNWIKKALALQSKSLERSLANEMQGSEIFELRRKEIEAVAVLITKF